MRQTPTETEAVMGEDSAQVFQIIRASDVVSDKVQPFFNAPSVRVIRARVIEELTQIDIAVDAARDEAEKIVQQAQAKAQQIREQAHLEGRSEGTREVLGELARARKVYGSALDAAEADMVEMAFRLAARIIGEALERDATRVASMVGGVLARARGRRDIVVMVCPEDLPALTQARPELLRHVDGVNIHFEVDPSLTRGGCVIQTESGRIDGRIETQLDALQKALHGE